MSEPNLGYVFRLRKCNPATEFKMVEDYDWFGPLKASYRLECFVKGIFYFLEGDFDHVPSRHWACICCNSFLPLGVIAIEDIRKEEGLDRWLHETIGPFREVSFQASGKWSWGQSFAPVFSQDQISISSREPWTVMFEQQFAALFSQIVTFGQRPEVQNLVEKYMTGYREWVHLKTPLRSPISVFYGVPEDWDSHEFWKGWIDLGEIGELLFDFWARDLDPWWLDTLRRQGQTIALVPNGMKLVWTSETEIRETKHCLSNASGVVREIATFGKAEELRLALTEQMVSMGKPVDDKKEARDILYEPWPNLNPYGRYPSVLSWYLNELDFWYKAEKYLESKGFGLAIVPIRGRSVLIPQND